MRLIVVIGGVEGVLVAAGLLGVVHREVGVDQDRSRRWGARRRVNIAIPSEAVTAALSSEERGVGADRGDDRVGDLGGFVAVGFWQQDGELVATEPGEHVGVAQALAQHLAIETISWSPALCPSVSLIVLKWSRSSTSTAPSGP